MADPSKIYENLPDAYDRRATSDLYKLLSGLAIALVQGQTELDDFRDDLTVVTADGDGLNRAGETLGVPRPPHLSDRQYAILIRTMVPAARGTIQAIRAVFEAETGLSNVRVEDRQTNHLIPHYEIWIYVTVNSYGYAAHAEPDAVLHPHVQEPWPPEGSCILGVVHDALDVYSGEYNDHWWADVDYWTRKLVDSVKLAGTIIVYHSR